jgi:glycosyltransferase involved in cell wall biosynthesis
MLWGGACPRPITRKERLSELKVMLLGDAFSFPNGLGATARVRAIARGLRDAGAQVEVIITRASERRSDHPVNPDAKGVTHGIPFEYTTGSSILHPNFWVRRIVEVRGMMRATWVALRGWDALIVFTTSSTVLPMVVASAARLRGAVIVNDGCELPFVFSCRTGFRRLYEWVYIRTVLRTYDGVIVISTFLDDYFCDKTRKGARNLLVPILVDVNEAESAQVAAASQTKTIVYSGDLGHVGEIEALLHAFAQLAPDHPDARLTILGDSVGTGRREDLTRLAAELELGEMVDFAGLVAQRDLPERLSRASVLVLPRAAGAFSTAGLPTKLAEYLATGLPVVVTAVGDIPRYLTDGEDAFLVAPGRDEAFRLRVEDVLDHPREAASVGRRGREVARREFDYRAHGVRIARFLGELKSGRRRDSV